MTRHIRHSTDSANLAIAVFACRPRREASWVGPNRAQHPFEIERAVAELAEARRLNGGDLFASIAHRKAGIWQGVPKIRALYEATYFAGLRKAGMPEE